MADPRQQLMELERSAWQALATEGAAGPFYDEVLADDVLMFLPGGLVIDDREQVVKSMDGPPWDDFELADERVVPLGPDAAVVAYRATARRDGQDYEALFNSTYVRENGRWRLVLHQQTPR
jgi:ketosteroid isomerase-like protein